MNLQDSFWDALDWLRALGRNRYFWSGVAVLAGVGFALYLIVDGLIMPSYTRHDVSTTVPNVESVPFPKAQEQLQRRDLQVQRQVGRYNPNVAQNVVVDQTPLPNAKVKPGRRVYLTVNAGEVPMVSMPDLNGMSVREAKNRISSLGLTVGSVQEDPIPSPYANTITKQTPAAGDSLEEGRSVDLWYSTGLGDSSVEIPNVVGQTVNEAQRQLLEQQLRSVVVDTASSDEADPATGRDTTESVETNLYVRRQGRSPGTSVRAGTEIRLFTTTDAEQAAALRESAADTTSAASDTTTTRPQQ
ncbi:penicillin-binding protein [Salinibacter sp. 10B]|uniref:PASTA domain-containing protein n=1 Tax=Salinibacter sp. 10B TaxID=1923971 RepID=UPI000CF3EEDF|nr:PASTA domain-containing protein [Salinibacter sp. 10B]PQJ35027.1 penicillin-binding protein [Salinibacter sp. 10B]